MTIYSQTKKRPNKEERERIKKNRLERLYNYLLEIHRNNDLSPTMREIQRDLGISSTWVVQNDIKTLVEQGMILFTPGKPRSIKIIEKNSQLPLKQVKGKSDKELEYLSVIERKVYRYIIEFFNVHHYAISIRELSDHFEISVGSVIKILDKLEEFNLIKRNAEIHRSIMIVEN